MPYHQTSMPLFHMKKSFFLILCLFLILFAVAAHAQKDDDDDDDDRPIARPLLKPGEKPLDADFVCPYTKEFHHPQEFDKYTLRMSVHLKDPAARCEATITSPKGRTAQLSEWALTVNQISGTDLNGDGKPDVVIEGYTGGERCCLNYTVVALTEPPRVLRKIETRSPLAFEKQPDGSVIIRGEESTFDYFIIPHFAAAIPPVFLKLEGNRLVNAGPQFREQYDKQIADAKSQLTQTDLDKFRQASYHQKMFTDQIPTVHRVLTIVLDYLYSGREAEAWKALDEFWPPSDRERVKNLIIERQHRGLFSQFDTNTQVTSAR